MKENIYVFKDSKDIYEAKKKLKSWNLFSGVAQLEDFQKYLKSLTDGSLIALIITMPGLQTMRRVIRCTFADGHTTNKPAKNFLHRFDHIF